MAGVLQTYYNCDAEVLIAELEQTSPGGPVEHWQHLLGAVAARLKGLTPPFQPGDILKPKNSPKHWVIPLFGLGGVPRDSNCTVKTVFFVRPKEKEERIWAVMVEESNWQDGFLLFLADEFTLAATKEATPSPAP